MPSKQAVTGRTKDGTVFPLTVHYTDVSQNLSVNDLYSPTQSATHQQVSEFLEGLYVVYYLHTCIRTYIHTYIHTYILTYIHTYILTYIHTYTHINTHINSEIIILTISVGYAFITLTVV